MFIKYISTIAIVVFSLSFISCTENNYFVQNTKKDEIKATVKKWFHGKESAISITYDGGWLPDLPFSTNEVLDRGLKMDFEMVSVNYENPYGLSILPYMSDSVYNTGIHFFGHGHKHYAHDTLSYDSAYVSFLTNYNLMLDWGLRPKAYAYPHSSGWLDRTQKANRSAGWIMARGFTPNEEEFYICPNNISQPENWYYLPSVVMSSDTSKDYYINNHSELSPILNKAKQNGSWVILMYHAINLPGKWGYYPIEEWRKDLDLMVELDFWSDNMDNIGLYIMERNNFEMTYAKLWETKKAIAYEIRFIDYFLDNKTYNQPLSVELSVNINRQFNYAIVEPAINNIDTLWFENNTISLDIVPDEIRYNFIFF
ncbi:MAG: hypothetical protein L3J41_07915 [Melioribacteraceae bacterium]|nr:hypothetical protein [Melioribacteraceae bacterium]